jgi:hypothetical protein
MNTQIELPATFTLLLSEEDLSFSTLSKKKLGDIDRPQLYYSCFVYGKGKTVEIKSPVFSKDDDAEKLRAYSILRELITETITRALLPSTECPQYERINGRVVAQIEPNPMRGEFGTVIESDGTERPAGHSTNP